MATAAAIHTLPTHDVTIRGKRYKITVLNTREGRRLWFKLIKLVGPGFFEFLRGGAAEGLEAEQAAPVLLTAVMSTLVEKLSPEDFEDFIQTFARSSSYIDEQGADFRLDALIDKGAFAADYGGLMQWLGQCMRLNFASFFSDLGITIPA